MLMILPILSFTGTNYSKEYGLRELFWYGSSNCFNSTECGQNKWVTTEVWLRLLKEYTLNVEDSDSYEPT